MAQSSGASPTSKSGSSSKSSPASGVARRARIVVAVAAAVVALAFVSAFGWPGWAVRTAPTPTEVPSAVASATPTVDPSALPDDASALLKAMPDHVAGFARGEAAATDAWESAGPVEEYAVVYTTGDAAKDVRLTVGQWADEEAAADQYDALAKALTGKQIAAGGIKVSGETTGSYLVAADKDDASRATAVWRNDTACFRLTGPTESVETVYRLFPL